VTLKIESNCLSVTAVNWQAIDTVFLDMDGTLLDLQFDNEFWLRTIPNEYARRQTITVEAAKAYLEPIFIGEAGKLNWYCLDFWSRTLGFNVVKLKEQVSHGINWRPEAREFLERLKASHCDVVLITNAHPETLRVKLERVNLTPWFDQVYSSHEFGEPKESQLFWERLQSARPFAPDRSLFIDDSESVLASAEHYGIKHLITLRQPDSQGPIRLVTQYPAILHFDEIYHGLADS